MGEAFSEDREEAYTGGGGSNLTRQLPPRCTALPGEPGPHTVKTSQLLQSTAEPVVQQGNEGPWVHLGTSNSPWPQKACNGISTSATGNPYIDKPNPSSNWTLAVISDFSVLIRNH